jgi:4-diphosphocytidyl-2-C-methyl-D-erythritol kinase
LNDKFNLNLSVEEQINYTKQLGSDCAFFIENKAVFASEKGDVFTPVTIDLSRYCIVLIYPAIHSNTALAYKGITPSKPEKSIKEIISQPIATWKHSLNNDFERNLFVQYPELESIKSKLYNAGALYASMSGSGSAMYGIFEKDVDVNALAFPADYLIKKSK